MLLIPSSLVKDREWFARMWLPWPKYEFFLWHYLVHWVVVELSPFSSLSPLLPLPHPLLLPLHFPFPPFPFFTFPFLICLFFPFLLFCLPPALLPGPCWAEKSQKLFSVNLLISSFPPSLAQNLLVLVFLWGIHVHFSMRSDNLDPPGMTNSHLQDHYKIHQIRSVRESGKAWCVGLAGSALPVLRDKPSVSRAWLGWGQGKVVLGKSRRWREQRRVLQAARDGWILPCSWPDTVALETARVNQWCRLKVKEIEMSPGVWKPGVETSLGLSLKVGKEQHKADKFLGNCLQSFVFMLFGSGGSGNPSWLCGLCGSGVL